MAGAWGGFSERSIDHFDTEHLPPEAWKLGQKSIHIITSHSYDPTYTTQHWPTEEGEYS